MNAVITISVMFLFSFVFCLLSLWGWGGGDLESLPEMYNSLSSLPDKSSSGLGRRSIYHRFEGGCLTATESWAHVQDSSGGIGPGLRND